MTETKVCYICWSKDANSYYRILKTDLKICLLHLKKIKQYPCFKTYTVTGSPLIDFDNNCVWLCPRCMDQCKQLLSAHNEIIKNTNLLKKISETYTPNILFHRNKNCPNASMEKIKAIVDVDADDSVKDEFKNIFSTNIKQNDTSDTSELSSNQRDRLSSSSKNVPFTESAWKDNTLPCRPLEVTETDKVVFAKTLIIGYGAPPFNCRNCRIEYDSYQKLIDHVCATVSECLVCDKVFKSQQELVEHKNQFRKCFLCDHCSARFHRKKLLARHRIRQHEDMMELNSFNESEHHQTQKNTEKSFSRHESKITSSFEKNPFKSSSEPFSEMAFNGLPRGFPSKISQSFPTSGNPFKLDSSTPMKTSQLETKSVTISKKRKKHYKCTSCSISFPKLKRFNIHSFEVHGLDNEHATQIKCTVCSKYFKKDNYDDHMKKHLGIRDYCCHMCNKKFLREYDLKQHQERRCFIVKI